MRRSLASRLQLAIGCGGGALLGLACVTLAILMQRTLLAEFDAALATEAKALSLLVERGEEGLHSEIRDRQPEQYDRADDPHYYQLRDHTGSSVERSPNLGKDDLLEPQPHQRSPFFANLLLPNGRPGRAILVSFEPHPEVSEPTDDSIALTRRSDQTPPASLTVARETSDLQRAIARTRLQLGAVFAGAIGILLAVVRPLVAYGLRPLKATTDQIDRIDEHHLDARIDVMPPRELEPVIARLNELLSRIDAAFQRERILSANVAHELRTPLAGIHATLDVALSRARSDVEMREAMGEGLRICRETEIMVESLLALSRIDVGKESVRAQATDLIAVIHDAWSLVEEAAQKKNVTVRWEIPESAHGSIDVAKLKIILKNLFQNAVSYVNDGGLIAFSLTVFPAAFELRIANTGSVLTQAEAQLAFDRFWRGESARSRTGQNAGLGLALCRELTDLLGGSISAESNPGGNFIVTLNVPPSNVSTSDQGCP